MTINIAGYYKIELSALMTLNKFQHRVEVFKKVSGTTCDKDSVILAVNARDLLTVTLYCVRNAIDSLFLFILIRVLR